MIIQFKTFELMTPYNNRLFLLGITINSTSYFIMINQKPKSKSK